MSTVSQIAGAEELSALSGILVIYIAILGFASIIGIVSYVFQSIGLYRMAKNLGFNNCWMAWVPFFSTYIFGKIGSKYVKRDGRPSAKFGGWLIGLEIALFLVLTGFIVSLVLTVIFGISMETAGVNSPSPSFLGGVISMLFTYLAILGISIAFSVIYYIAYWRMLSIFDSSNATAFLIISILFSITLPFFIFAVSKNTPCLTQEERMGFSVPSIPNE